MVKEKLSKKALTEAYEILKLLDEESLEKIPERLLDAMAVNRDKTYVVDIQKAIEGDVLQETKDILCAMYCEYLATEEEKKVIEKYAKSVKTETQYEEDKFKVGIPVELLKKEIKQEVYEQPKEMLPDVVYKKNIITIVIDRIKSLFRK